MGNKDQEIKVAYTENGKFLVVHITRHFINGVEEAMEMAARISADNGLEFTVCCKTAEVLIGE